MAQQANLQQIADAIAQFASSIRGNTGSLSGSTDGAGPSRGSGGLSQGQIDQIIQAITQALRDNPAQIETDEIEDAIRGISPAITQAQLDQIIGPLEAITGLGSVEQTNLIDVYNALRELRDEGISTIPELSMKLTDILNRLSGQVGGRPGIVGIPVNIVGGLPRSLTQPGGLFGAVGNALGIGGGGQAGPDPAMNTVADFFNPFAGKSDQALKDEFRRLGLERYEYLVDTDKGRAAQKLNILREMDEYAYDMINTAAGGSYYVDEGFQRKAFDVFVNTYKSNPKGVPLEQTYKYLPKSIPESKVKFDGKQYNLMQDGKKFSAKNFRDIERMALKGGDYSAELAVFRDIKESIDKQEKPMNIIFKARKW